MPTLRFNSNGSRGRPGATPWRRFRHVVTARFRVLGKRVSDIETALDPLVDHVAHAERGLQDLDERVTRLERELPGRRTRARSA